MGAHLLEFLKNKKTVSVCAFFAPSNPACFLCLSKIRYDLRPIYETRYNQYILCAPIKCYSDLFLVSYVFIDFFLSNGKQDLADTVLCHV